MCTYSNSFTLRPYHNFSEESIQIPCFPVFCPWSLSGGAPRQRPVGRHMYGIINIIQDLHHAVFYHDCMSFIASFTLLLRSLFNAYLEYFSIACSNPGKPILLVGPTSRDIEIQGLKNPERQGHDLTNYQNKFNQ